MIKKTLTLFTIICLSFNLFGQCKYEINEIDKFTNQSKIETKSEIIYKDFNTALSINLCKYDTTYFIKIGINLTDQVYSVLKGDKILLKLENSQIVEIISLETKIISGFSYVKYSINSGDFVKLKSSLITDIRIYLNKEYIDRTIDNKKGSKIKIISNCI
jgi:hypothetical protein